MYSNAKNVKTKFNQNVSTLEILTTFSTSSGARNWLKSPFLPIHWCIRKQIPSYKVIRWSCASRQPRVVLGTIWDLQPQWRFFTTLRLFSRRHIIFTCLTMLFRYTYHHHTESHLYGLCLNTTHDPVECHNVKMSIEQITVRPINPSA